MASATLDLRPPQITDGAGLWHLAQRAGKLDVNSSYAYLLWARDFSATSVVAVDAAAGPRGTGALAGFITGYRRPDEPDVLLVWQVAVDPDYRRRGLAAAMLDHLADRARGTGCRWLETTVTPDNAPSLALFNAFAARRGAPLATSELFGREDFPDPHEAENLLRIGPLS